MTSGSILTSLSTWNVLAIFSSIASVVGAPFSSSVSK